MNTQVSDQILLAVKSHLTHITNVSFLWLCASVFAHVIIKGLFPRETLSTFSTSKQLLSSVNDHVTLQVLFVVKRFLTDITDVSSHTQVFVLNMLF